MGLLTFESFLSQTEQDLRGLKKPTGRPRRVDVTDYLDDGLSELKGSLFDILEHAGERGPKKSLEHLEDYLINLMSLLYAAGSPHDVWRRWAALVAFSQVLSKKHYSACVYAALAGEWAAIDEMPSRSAEKADFEKQVLWHILGKSSKPPAPDGDDAEESAWLLLSRSIPKSNHRETESALKTVAEFWLSELGDTWDHYEPDAYPTFHAPACAAAAIARHHGYKAEALSRDQARFLEPGLATGEPPPLVPSVWRTLG
jgi:hypothetical protein